MTWASEPRNSGRGLGREGGSEWKLMLLTVELQAGCLPEPKGGSVASPGQRARRPAGHAQGKIYQMVLSCDLWAKGGI